MLPVLGTVMRWNKLCYSITCTAMQHRHDALRVSLCVAPLTDIRINENLPLASLVTLLVRYHNSVANSLLGKNPTWDDDHIFEVARRTVIATIQVRNCGLTRLTTTSESIPSQSCLHRLHQGACTPSNETHAHLVSRVTNAV